MLSSSNQVSAGGIPTDNFRERNLAEAGARYQGVAGPVSIYAFGAYIGANHVNYTGPAVTPAILGIPGSKYNGQVTDVSAGFVGAAVTIAGFQFGGAWQGGHYNGIMAPAPNGAPPAEAYLVGVQYINGPFTIGASWYGFDQQGAVAVDRDLAAALRTPSPLVPTTRSRRGYRSTPTTSMARTTRATSTS